MDSGADHRPARCQQLQRTRHELARRRKDDRRIELHRCNLVGSSRPCGTQAPCELLGALVSGSRERVDVAPLVDGNLADHVGGRSEAEQAQRGGVAGEAQRAVADQAAAQQRRRLLGGEVVGKRQAEALVGDGQLRVAAVDVTPGEARVDAQVLAV